jgi:hypothetical protein
MCCGERKSQTSTNLAKRALSEKSLIVVEVYGGVDLSPVARDIRRAYPLALKVFSENVMRTASLALELNALTAELDEQMASALFPHTLLKHQEIDLASYLQAFQTVSSLAVRLHQLKLAEDLLASLS